MGSGAKTRVQEQVNTYRDEPGTLAEVVAKLEANGWRKTLEHEHFTVLRHPQMPGHSRIIDNPMAMA